MKLSLKIGTRLILFLFLAACTFAPKETQLVSTNQVDTSTPIVIQKPTLTPQPTQTQAPIATRTFTPWPTKEVLAQFGVFGGDGGWDYYAFIGGDMPKWVLYTDGQLLVQKEDHGGAWFEETTLTVPQMCTFLSQIEEAGFYSLAVNDSFEPAYPTDYPNPIYNFSDTTQFSEGGSNYVLQVNGPNPRQIQVYQSYEPYLVPEARRVFNFFDNYSPPSKITPYQPKYLLLRIEEGLGNSIYATPAPAIQEWPTNLPPLKILATENVDTVISASSAEPLFSQVLVANAQATTFFAAFGNRLAYWLFQSEDEVYYVAARPFLPHETLNDFSKYPQQKQYALPFSCSN